MGWFGNPFVRRKAPADADSSDAEAALGVPSPPAPAEPDAPPPPPRPSQDLAAALRHLKTPTEALTIHQVFYIFVLDGLGAAVLSGGINFAIAYAMYTSPSTQHHPVRLFALPNTLAGDAAVTLIVQSLITWLIECGLVGRDLRVGGVSPIGFLAPPRARWLRRVFLLDEAAPRASPRHNWVLFLVEQVARAMVMAVGGFVLLWPMSVGCLIAVGTREGGDWVFKPTWAPQVFKLVLGAVWSLLQTPVCAAFWLVREGWVLRAEEEEAALRAEEGVGGGEDSDGGGEDE